MPWSRIRSRWWMKKTVLGRLLVTRASGNRARPGLVDSSDPAADVGLDVVTEILDPILVPLGFAPGQVGVDGGRGQVIFCRGVFGSSDGGCIDLVLEVEATPDWQITDVRYWGFPSDRWHLDLDRGAPLALQLAGLAETLPSQLR